MNFIKFYTENVNFKTLKYLNLASSTYNVYIQNAVQGINTVLRYLISSYISF